MIEIIRQVCPRSFGEWRSSVLVVTNSVLPLKLCSIRFSLEKLGAHEEANPRNRRQTKRRIVSEQTSAPPRTTSAQNSRRPPQTRGNAPIL